MNILVNEVILKQIENKTKIKQTKNNNKMNIYEKTRRCTICEFFLDKYVSVKSKAPYA